MDLQMFSSSFAIQVRNLSKCYNVYNQPSDRLKQSVIPKVLRVFGMPSRTYYREFWALQNVSLDVKKGETVGIIGRNGSGKSTLLQLISRTLMPTVGSVETNGRITALLELGSGFNPEFTGRENVFLNGAILGLSQKEIQSRFDAIAEFADIGNFIEQPVKFYSSGMTVRLAFAVQAMVDPDILIVDEALAVGDELFQKKCFRRLDELKRTGTSILFVSHAGHQIMELCDRALLLERGQRVLMTDPVTTVKAYHRLIYAPPDSQVDLVRELKELDCSTDKDLQKVGSDASNKKYLIPIKTDEKLEDVDFFEENMKPQSTEFFPVLGAELSSIKIYNDNDLEVNNLLPGKQYKFEIQGKFIEERDFVYFLLYIGRVSGPALFSWNHPGVNQYIDHVSAGQRFKVSQKIRMDLTPSTYFVTASVNSFLEPTCMHKIVDAIMFRILPKTVNRAFGYVDLTIGEPEFKIIEE
jgi:lipopolysaccharide transport system ATP-binding protein